LTTELLPFCSCRCPTACSRTKFHNTNRTHSQLIFALIRVRLFGH
jgi:hypothetical protein